MVSGREEAQPFDNQALLRALFDDGPDAVLCTDSSGAIIKVNRRAAALFGYEPAELIGMPIESLIPERLRSRHERARERFKLESSPRALGTALNIIGRRKDRTEFPAAINLSPQSSPSGDFVAAVVADISDLRRAQAELQESVESYRELIEHSPDARFLLEANGRIVFVNTTGLTLLRAGSASQIVGRTFADFVRTDHRASVTSLLQGALDDPQTVAVAESKLLRLDGGEVFVETLVAPVRSQGTATIQAVVRDISERKRAEALHLRALAAEESDRLKTDLLSAVSHELRTPLTNIRGYASTVLEYFDRLEQLEIVQYLQGVDAAAQHLERIVSDLLTLSRIENGVFSLELADLYLGTFLEKVIASQHTTRRLDIRLDQRGPDRLIRADRGRLLQVMTNLLDNAAVHGDASRPIQVTSICSPEYATVSVRDLGPGVPRSQLDTIFLPYYRVTDKGRASARGSGLGLAICQGIISAHGGHIWADSPAAGGFKVSFTLPLAT